MTTPCTVTLDPASSRLGMRGGRRTGHPKFFWEPNGFFFLIKKKCNPKIFGSKTPHSAREKIKSQNNRHVRVGAAAAPRAWRGLQIPKYRRAAVYMRMARAEPVYVAFILFVLQKKPYFVSHCFWGK